MLEKPLIGTSGKHNALDRQPVGDQLGKPGRAGWSLTHLEGGWCDDRDVACTGFMEGHTRLPNRAQLLAGVVKRWLTLFLQLLLAFQGGLTLV